MNVNALPSSYRDLPTPSSSVSTPTSLHDEKEVDDVWQQRTPILDQNLWLHPANSQQLYWGPPTPVASYRQEPPSPRGIKGGGVMSLESLAGQVVALGRDQYGCRFLQNKIEDGDPAAIAFIVKEVYAHMIELMTDPFGNYLCQRLFEHANDEQRTMLALAVAPELVSISLHLHGTRAVQRMIENLTHPHQVRIVIMALRGNVVTLIKDLNGNHVIQKCLNHFTSEENQFIYDAVCEQCVEVATHRHGCCVLQRCFDHASSIQKAQLAAQVTKHALVLSQDAYGNYVVQYILDLGERRMFSEALIRQFVGHISTLSVQKFSSNAIEKCIRVADPETRRLLIAELLDPEKIERLLHDPYGNYVVQTALERADPTQRELLVECVRPLLPGIRNTPYGKRIHSKLQRQKPQGGGKEKGNGNLRILPTGAMGEELALLRQQQQLVQLHQLQQLQQQAQAQQQQQQQWHQLMRACYVAHSLGVATQSSSNMDANAAPSTGSLNSPGFGRVPSLLNNGKFAGNSGDLWSPTMGGSGIGTWQDKFRETPSPSS
ncbi:uncharacterized protein VTP21DRAFT_5040 [Calcarisporiella thermophila]|uniref:uncharacterized protein n=1 Tax=Calcarisporiella thermophila TaxID=911321 RepID=UPI003742A708